MGHYDFKVDHFLLGVDSLVSPEVCLGFVHHDIKRLQSDLVESGKVP